MTSAAKPLLRDRHGHAHVTNEELFFDLIYAFAITQLSHRPQPRASHRRRRRERPAHSA